MPGVLVQVGAPGRTVLSILEVWQFSVGESSVFRPEEGEEVGGDDEEGAERDEEELQR